VRGPERTTSVPRDEAGKKDDTPLPLLSGKACMLLKTMAMCKNVSGYPTMSMIIHGLLANLREAIYYFQHDSLLKSLKIGSNMELTHDVYDQKWFSVKIRKAGLFFSIIYRKEDNGNCAAFGAEPTMCIVDKDLASNRHFPAVSYVVENKTRSFLAPKGNGLRTHYVYEDKWFNPI
jgi:hypothetical protein